MSNNSDSRKEILPIILALSFGVGLIYLAFLKPGIWGIDGTEMFFVSNSLVTEGDFSLPPGAGIVGADGQYYSIRYPLLPIVATPFVAVGLFLGHLLNIPPRYAAGVCALVLSVLLTVATTGLIVLLSLRLGAKKQSAYLAALSFAFGTTALVYARQFFAEPLLSFMTTLSLYLALGKTYREHAIASFIGGLAIAAKPAGVVIGPVLALYFGFKRYPIRTVISPLVGTGMGLMLYFGYNYLRFGDFFTSGQNASKFQFAGMLERLVGLIFSPGAGGGLIWYCTPVVLVIIAWRKLWKTQPIEALAVLGIFCGYWVLHSFWRFGGWSWGPRFLVPTLPALFAVIGLLDRKWWRWLIVLTVIGLFWNAPTLVSFFQRYYAEASDGRYIRKVLSLWGDPSYAPLFNAWGAAFRQVQEAFNTDIKEVLSGVGIVPSKGELASSDLLRIVAVWWWMLPVAGIPIWIGFLMALMMIALGVWSLRRGWLLSNR